MKTEILKKCLEEGQSLSNAYELLTYFPEAHSFIKRFKDKCIFVKCPGGAFIVRLYSDKYEYTISFIKTPDGKYCSCGYTCRVNRPMETWSRGNDMSDGNNIEHVLEDLKNEILDNELQTFGTVSLEEEKTVPERAWGRNKWIVPEHHSFTVEESPITYVNKLLKKYFELTDGKE